MIKNSLHYIKLIDEAILTNWKLTNLAQVKLESGNTKEMERILLIVRKGHKRVDRRGKKADTCLIAEGVEFEM